MSALPPVCILTAGKGSRMGPLADTINKALLPLKGKAIISHIIDSFPADAAFVIATGHHSRQVRDYLAIAHPHLAVNFVDVDRYEGLGTGPGYSLLCCYHHLQRPFYFVSCDTLFKWDEPAFPAMNTNWIGIAPIAKENQLAYCNVAIDTNQRVNSIHDKEAVNGQSYAFTGLMYIFDYKCFWDGLIQKKLVKDELQVSNGLMALVKQDKLYAIQINWTDVGDYEKYRFQTTLTGEYDFSKTDEFLYLVNKKVIKFFYDSNIVSSRIKKAAIKTHVFPSIDYSGKQFYSYHYISGQTLYAFNSVDIFKKLLQWLDKEVWTAVPVEKQHLRDLCEEFYKTKTTARLLAFEKKYNNKFSPSRVNGIAVLTAKEIMKRLPWEELYEGIPTFMHGDLQFDNILYDKENNKFILLDWRQDFVGEVAYGDLYYDLAKLLGGIIINYDYIKAGLFHVKLQDDHISIDFAHRYLGDSYKKILEEFINRKNLSFRRVNLLVGLIYLNMSPLHHPPFDQLLHSLARLHLTQALVN